MASLSYRFVIHGILLVLGLLISPGQSLTCTSQKFTNNKVYANCSDLPYLSAFLHWNYSSANSSLSIAFVATPSKTDGWVSWGINPNNTGMIGSQALVAYISNGVATVKPLDITSFDLSKAGTKLSYDVSDLTAENSNGTIKIFATWKLPAKTEKVNQVWQVGPSMTQGLPDQHDMKADNLKANKTLEFVGATSTPSAAPSPNSPTSSPAPTNAPGSTTTTTSAPGGSPNNGGSSRLIRGTSRMVVGFFFVLIGSFIVL